MHDEPVLESSLRVATLNIWGLPDFINRAPSKILDFYEDTNAKRSTRIKRIIDRLNDFDVVCFQEVWLRPDRNKIIKAAKEMGLKYTIYFHSGRSLYYLSKILFLNEDFGDGTMESGFGIGSGMLIVSRFPICHYAYKPFELCGKPQRIQHG